MHPPLLAPARPRKMSDVPTLVPLRDVRFTNEFEESLNRGEIPSDVREALESFCSNSNILAILRTPAIDEVKAEGGAGVDPGR